MIYLNGTPLNVTIFPDNTSQVWKLPESTFKSNKAEIVWEFSNESEVMHIMQLQHLLITENHNIETTLKVKYLPYARQDKHVNNNSTFALQTFLRIFSNFNFRRLIVIDPHNPDAVRPNSAFSAVYPIEQVSKVMELTKSDLVCYPDKGALTKYTSIYDYPHIYGEKVREQSTGNILNYQVVGNPLNKTVLIIDDICDGGMTFKLLAKDLLAAGAKEVNLFVTHGIFSKGIQTLKESGINKVFTQDGEASEYQQQLAYRRL